MPSHSRRRTRVGARRPTTWARVQQTHTFAAANTYLTFDMLGNFKADGGTQQGVTVLRTHLRMQWTTVVAAGDNYAWGLIRGQNTDVGTSIAGAPVPDLDPYEDWLMWEHLYASYFDANGVYSPSGATNVLSYDIRAKRKLPELQMSYNLVQKSLAAGTYPATCQIDGSILLALP